MSSNTIYTIGYLDYANDKFVSSKNVYTDIISASYDLNYTIQSIIFKKFDVLLPHKFTFIPKNEKANCTNDLKLEYGKYLLINKNEYTIDIYLKKEKKGYVYNSSENIHVFKFLINEHISGEPQAKAFNLDTDELKIQFEHELEAEPEVVEILLNNNYDNLIKELTEKIQKFKTD